MASPSFLSGGSTPNINDTRWMILQRILGAMVDGGGGSVGSGALTLGAGAPASGTTGTFYWDTTNKNLYVIDADGVNIH